MSLKDFLRDTLELGRDDLFKVDVKESFSFFNTDAHHVETVMETLNNLRIDGRKINVEISKTDGAKNEFRRDHNGRGKRKFDGKPENQKEKRFSREKSSENKSGRKKDFKPAFEKAKRSRRS